MSTQENFVTDLAEETVDQTGITETMTREQFETYFHENREIVYKGYTLGVMDWQDGRFDVLTPDESEAGFSAINPNPFNNACDAINFAIDHLLERDGQTSKSNKKSSSKKKTEPEYNGPRLVRVFGRDIYMEEDPKVTQEQIREKLVTEYNFSNFKKGKVFFDFDSSTGILEVLLKFQTKG